MTGQFLLNYDGSIPDGAPVETIKSLGIIFVIPTVPPACKFDEELIEDEPQQNEKGQYLQVWKTRKIELASIEEIEIFPDLTPAQFEYVLSFGLGKVWDELEVNVEKIDLEIYAKIRMQRKKTIYNFEATVAMVQQFKPYCDPDADLSRETIAALWRKAASET